MSGMADGVDFLFVERLAVVVADQLALRLVFDVRTRIF